MTPLSNHKAEEYALHNLYKYLPFSFTRFPANFLQISRIFPNFVTKLRISMIIPPNGLDTTKVLKIHEMCNF